MYESENTVMSPDEELVEILLDFIIVSANLAKNISRSFKQKKIKGSAVNRKIQQTECGY